MEAGRMNEHRVRDDKWERKEGYMGIPMEHDDKYKQGGVRSTERIGSGLNEKEEALAGLTFSSSRSKENS